MIHLEPYKGHKEPRICRPTIRYASILLSHTVVVVGILVCLPSPPPTPTPDKILWCAN